MLSLLTFFVIFAYFFVFLLVCFCRFSFSHLILLKLYFSILRVIGIKIYCLPPTPVEDSIWEEGDFNLLVLIREDIIVEVRGRGNEKSDFCSIASEALVPC